MKITGELTDTAVLAELGERIAAARLRRNLTQAETAREAGVSKRTLEALEAGDSVRLVSLLRVLRVLGVLDGLDAVVPSPGPTPLELLRVEQTRRQRASGSHGATPSGEWEWGDA